ncbi:MAG: hypothetical protein NC911_01330 [Candidatus Omnitrophica bacterium]|nr:hypothetical protein [Candidatus Omnitrophota bacterium]
MRNHNLGQGKAEVTHLFCLFFFLLPSFTLFGQSAKKLYQEDFSALNLSYSPSFGISFKTGGPETVQILVETEKGEKKTVSVRAMDQKGGGYQSKFAETLYPDSILKFQGAINLDYYIRPRVKRYTDKQIEEKQEGWKKMPGASEKFVRIEIHPDKSGYTWWLDGRYAGRFDTTNRLKNFTITGGPKAEVKDREVFLTPEDDIFLPINYALVAQPGAMREASISLSPGFQKVKGIPFIVSDGNRSGDISLVKEMRGSFALECDEYLSRTAFDGMPESQLVSVPQAFYYKAWVLFAVDPDPKKDPILTVRLTRLASRSTVGRGTAFADTYLPLPRPGEKPSPNIVQVGTVKHKAESKEIELPLYLAEVTLPLGEMMDLLWQKGQDEASELRIGEFLDFEFLGRRGTKGREHKPTGSPSAGNIFGVTLEKAPAEFRLEQRQPGNIFLNEEKPEVQAVVKANLPGKYTLIWTITDVKGKQLQRREKTLSLVSGQEESYVIPLNMAELGYYGLKFEFLAEGKKEILSHKGSFALLGADTRQAGYESPYGSWWFDGPHLSIRQPEIAGSLYLKAGLRKFAYSNRYTEEELAPWKMTKSSFPWLFRLSDLTEEGKLSEEAKQRVANYLKEQMARYPHCNSVLIFHESHGNNTPLELAGVTPTFTDQQEKDCKKKVLLATQAAEFYRQNFPQLKIIFGNTSGSAHIVADLLRFGFKPEKNIDYVGMETPGQTFMPELVDTGSTMAIWMVREIGRMYGYQLPVTSCYEYTSRPSRVLGEERQAEYYTRDGLLGLAHRFDHINPGLIADVGSSYFNTYIYGGGGFTERYPLLYPKPSFVAMATLTRVLDKVKLRRVVPTGSLTVYALEFDRQRTPADIAYAFWTPRGQAQLTLNFPGESEIIFVDTYGQEKKIRTSGGKASVSTSTSPTYVLSSLPANQVLVTKRTYSEDAPPPGFNPANRMDKLEEWRKITDYSFSGHFSRRGNFLLRQVNDPEKGPCLELELQKTEELPALVAEYTAIKLKKPIEVPGKPHTIGVWVKGNSSWSKIIFEIEDGEGRLWRSSGGYHDWAGDLTVNFDGWRFLRFFIDSERSPIKNVSPGRQWESNGGGAWPPSYPIKISGLYVLMKRKAIDPVEMREVVPILRFKDIGAYE